MVISALDALQLDDKLEAAAHIFSGLVPRIVGGLLVVLFAKEWSVVLLLLVLIANSIFLSKIGNVSETCTKLSSCFSSVNVPVLMKEKITNKERGIAKELQAKDKVKNQKTLGLFSLVNLSVFLLITTLFVVIIYFSSSIKTNINNIVSEAQMMEIFLFIFLPACGLSIISSVMMYFMPAAKLKGKVRAVKSVINSIVIIAAILIPILSGIFLVSPGLQTRFVFAKVSKRIRNKEEIGMIFVTGRRQTGHH